jgi:hypothetical protein
VQHWHQTLHLSQRNTLVHKRLALSVRLQAATAEDSSQLTQPGDGSSEYEECMALLLGTDA